MERRIVMWLVFPLPAEERALLLGDTRHDTLQTPQQRLITFSIFPYVFICPRHIVLRRLPSQ